MPLVEAERLPYLGVGAWFVGQNLGGQGATGLQLRPTLGILWGRHDVARLRTEASYFVDLFEERELGSPDPRQRARGTSAMAR